MGYIRAVPGMKTHSRRMHTLALIFVLLFMDLANPVPGAAVQAQTAGWVDLSVPQAPGGNILALVAALSNPSVMYTFVDGKQAYRLYRSLDAGQTWQPRSIFSYWNTLNRQLAVNPADPDVVYAYGQPQTWLQLSVDGGATWETLKSFGEIFTAVSASRLYAAGGIEKCSNSYGYLYNFSRSDDGGQTWQNIALGCLSRVLAIASLPAQPELIYLIGVNSGTDSILFKSTDGGLTWSQSSQLFAYPNTLLIDPADPDRLYASGYNGVFASKDAGISWQQVIGKISGVYYDFSLALSQGILYAAQVNIGPAPLYRSQDGGVTWWASFNRLPSGAAALYADPTQPDRVWAGLVNYGIYFSENGGANWSEQNSSITSTTTIDSLAASSSDPNVLYAAVDYPYPGVYRSLDGGQTWGPRMPGLEDAGASLLQPSGAATQAVSQSPQGIVSPTFIIHKLVVDPSDPLVAWLATSYGIYETTDGLSWRLAPLTTDAQGDQTGPIDIKDLAVSAADPDHPHAVLHDYQSRAYFASRWCDAKLICRWSGMQNSPGSQLLFDVLAFDPAASNRLLTDGVVASLSGDAAALFQSLDGGYTWQAFSTINLAGTISSLVIAPQNPRLLVANVDIIPGVPWLLYGSTDGGLTWQNWANGLPATNGAGWSVAIDDLDIVYAGSGWGLYRRMPTATTWEPYMQVGVYPNPVRALLYRPGPERSLFYAGDQFLWRLDSPPPQRTWFPWVSAARP